MILSLTAHASFGIPSGKTGRVKFQESVFVSVSLDHDNLHAVFRVNTGDIL
jgi:hypothetical protein